MSDIVRQNKPASNLKSHSTGSIPDLQGDEPYYSILDHAAGGYWLGDSWGGIGVKFRL